MDFLKKYGLYIFAAVITIIGIITGWYLFILLVLPISLFWNKKDKD